MAHELLGRVLYLEPRRNTAWRVTSVQLGKASVVSLATKQRSQELVEELLALIAEGALYVSN